MAAMTPVPEMMPVNANSSGRGHLKLAHSIRSLRLRSGLSQRQLALRMSVPRTYVSKIENEKLMEDQFVADVMPYLSQLNGMQMSSILAQVRDLTVRPRRSA